MEHMPENDILRLPFGERPPKNVRLKARLRGKDNLVDLGSRRTEKEKQLALSALASLAEDKKGSTLEVTKPDPVALEEGIIKYIDFSPKPETHSTPPRNLYITPPLSPNSIEPKKRLFRASQPARKLGAIANKIIHRRDKIKM